MNKRSIISSLLFVIAAALVVCFGVFLWQDYTAHYQYGSAPFYLYVAERAIEFLLPSIVCLVVGGFIRRKQPKQD